MTILCHGDINKLEKPILKIYQKETGCTWGVFGEDYKAFDKLHQRLGYINRDIEVGPLFQEISWELREPMLQYMGKLSKCNHSLEWWSTGLASKSIFQQDLFLRVCFIKLLEEMEKKGKNVIFYIVDADFFFFLKDLLAGRFRFITDTSYLICRVKRCFRLSLQKYKRFIKIILNKLLTVRMFNEPFGMETLVFSWIVGNSFNKSCDYKDLWGGSFYEEFSKYSECKRFVFSYVKLRVLRKSFLSGTSFIYTASYCSWKELFSVLFRKVTLNNNFEYTFQDINLKVLVDDEIRKNNAGLIHQYLVFYKGLCRIIKKSTKLKMVFHPFEGQPWEKMIKLATMESGKEIKTFGFQHSAFSELHLSNFCSIEEYGTNTMPDYILTNSNYNKRKLGKDGFPKERIITIGDLRFGHNAGNGEKHKPSKSNAQEIRTILVCLTVGKEESLVALYDCCHTFINLKKMGYQFKVYIKPHPLTNIDINELPLIKELSGCLEYFGGDIEGVLAKSDLLIYLHGAVGCEALQQGKTVLQKMSDLSIDKDPLNPDEKKKFLYSCFFHEIEYKLQMLLSDNDSGKKLEDDRAQIPSFFDSIQYCNFEKVAQLAGIR